MYLRYANFCVYHYTSIKHLKNISIVNLSFLSGITNHLVRIRDFKRLSPQRIVKIKFLKNECELFSFNLLSHVSHEYFLENLWCTRLPRSAIIINLNVIVCLFVFLPYTVGFPGTGTISILFMLYTQLFNILPGKQWLLMD